MESGSVIGLGNKYLLETFYDQIKVTRSTFKYRKLLPIFTPSTLQFENFKDAGSVFSSTTTWARATPE